MLQEQKLNAFSNISTMCVLLRRFYRIVFFKFDLYGFIPLFCRNICSLEKTGLISPFKMLTFVA